ncbi:MAG: DNA-binding response regulator [Chloroflexi bacterium RBG_16_50_9]|nr:MAG: DNA-binding response regulator [Chloroflexi bacterium RBG_16_50_9]
MSKIRLLLADDHAVLRAGLKTLLNAEPDMEVVAEAANGGETILKSNEFLPDIVLMDITMPGQGGLEATREIKKRNPAIKVLVLTMHEDESFLYEMLRAGADGYVPKKAADTELLAAIRATYRGEHFIHSSMTAQMVTEARNKQGTKMARNDGISVLSEREREVLRFLALGYTNQQIADTIYLSVKTVETYKARLRDKLGLRGRAEFVRYAMEAGLVDM